MRATELDSGAVIVALDQTNSVAVIGFGPSGQTLWAKELRGAAIPVIDATNGPPHEVTLVPMDGSDALLQISASQTLGEENYSTSVLARLAADGTLRWMRKVQNRLSSMEPNPFGDAVRVTPSGDIVLEMETWHPSSPLKPRWSGSAPKASSSGPGKSEGISWAWAWSSSIKPARWFWV